MKQKSVGVRDALYWWSNLSMHDIVKIIVKAYKEWKNE
jgi:hypothetical protein